MSDLGQPNRIWSQNLGPQNAQNRILGSSYVWTTRYFKVKKTSPKKDEQKSGSPLGQQPHLSPGVLTQFCQGGRKSSNSPWSNTVTLSKRNIKDNLWEILNENIKMIVVIYPGLWGWKIRTKLRWNPVGIYNVLTADSPNNNQESQRASSFGEMTGTDEN